MIRWNKWTRDYTYTYEWDSGTWRLIHKKSNKPVVSWIKSWYNLGRNRLNDISSQWLKVQFITEFYTITDKNRQGRGLYHKPTKSKRIV